MFCKKCGVKYIVGRFGWCKPCWIYILKRNFTNWTSGNERIDKFVQEMQLKIDNQWDIVFEWIPYNRFSDIKEIVKSDFATVYSAIWKDGPLNYNQNTETYVRTSLDQKVALK